MILVDAGPLVALVDVSDEHHARCVEVLKDLGEPMGTVWPAVTEALDRLLDVPEGQEAVLETAEARDGPPRAPRPGGRLPGEGPDGEVPGPAAWTSRTRRWCAWRNGTDWTGSSRSTGRDFEVYRIGKRKTFRIMPEGPAGRSSKASAGRQEAAEADGALKASGVGGSAVLRPCRATGTGGGPPRRRARGCRRDEPARRTRDAASTGRADRAGATRVRHGQVALEVAGADRALGAGRGSARVNRDRRRGAGLRPLESPVDGQPLAVLPGLALAGGKRRKALGARRDAVALAVGEHLGTDLLLGVWCAAHGLNDAPRPIILSTYLDNHYNMSYRNLLHESLLGHNSLVE